MLVSGSDKLYKTTVNIIIGTYNVKDTFKKVLYIQCKSRYSYKFM